VRWGRAGGRIAVGLALVLAFAIALYAGAVLGSRTDLARARVEAFASEASGYDVSIGSLGLDWYLGARVTDLTVGPRDGGDPFLAIGSVEAAGLPAALLGSTSAAIDVVVRAPLFRLGTWEPPERTDAEPGRGFSLPPGIRSVDVRDGLIEAGGAERIVAIGPMDFRASALEAAKDLRLGGRSSVAGASGELEWTAEVAPGGERLAIGARLEVSRLAGLAEELGTVLPTSLAEATAEIEIEAHGAIGAPLAATMHGRLTGGPDAIAFLTDGTGEGDLASGRIRWELRARPEEEGRSIASADSELKLGTASLAGELDLVATTAKGRLELAGFGWSRADGGAVAEGLAVGGRVEVDWGEPLEEPILRVDLRATAGEVLLAGRYYLGLAATPVSFAGTLRRKGAIFSLADGKIGSPRLGSARLDASLGDDGLSADVRPDVPDVAPLFALAVRDPWQEAFPTLAGTEIGGAIGGRLRVRWSDGALASLDGRLAWRRGRIAVAKPELRVGEVALDLPIHLGAGRATADERGSLQLRGLAIGGVAVAPLELALVAGKNRLALASPARTTALDGEVVLTELAANDVASSPILTLGLRATGLRLAPIATSLGLPAFGGTFTAELPRVRLAGGTLETEGEIVLSAFGGTVRLERLRASDVGSGVATISLDAACEDVSLGALTEVLDLGHVSGVARGGLKDLEMQAGSPVRFEAWMETVKTSGVAQRISVDAIRSLSILGGSGGDPFSSGVLSFFDEYGYAKIGFRCSLDGDRLTLEGVEQKDGKDYLVVGSLLPPRVDVVSHTRTIAFSEMVSRLRRAAQSEGPRVE
jgi:hypothetical protein